MTAQDNRIVTWAHTIAVQAYRTAVQAGRTVVQALIPLSALIEVLPRPTELLRAYVIARTTKLLS